MDCSSITDFQQSTAIRIAKKFRNLHIGKVRTLLEWPVELLSKMSEWSGVEWSGYPLDCYDYQGTCGAINEYNDKTYYDDNNDDTNNDFNNNKRSFRTLTGWQFTQTREPAPPPTWWVLVLLAPHKNNNIIFDYFDQMSTQARLRRLRQYSSNDETGGALKRRMLHFSFQQIQSHFSNNCCLYDEYCISIICHVVTM